MADEQERFVTLAREFNVDQQLVDLGFDGKPTQERTVALFTGQFGGYWSKDRDNRPLTREHQLAAMARDVKAWGYDAIGAVTWSDIGIDPVLALGEDGKAYLTQLVKALHAQGLGVTTVGDHLATQAIAAAIVDEHLLGIMPADVMDGMTKWGVIGSPALQERIRENAALHLMNTARAVTRFKEVAREVVGSELQERLYNPIVITGFNGSQTWHLLAGFPPVSAEATERGYQMVAYRLARPLDVLAEHGLKYGSETHPGEQNIDLVSAQRLARTINKPNWGYNGDSTHSVGRGWNYLMYLRGIGPILNATHLKGAAEQGDGSAAVYSDLDFGNPQRAWDFRSIGRGTKGDAVILRTLDEIGYKGSVEIEWEDSLFRDAAGARASALIVRGTMRADEAMVRQGLEMYRDVNNYGKAKFDAAFEAKKA
ncbi:MAG TPA: TIM barrel protein [Candidatus Nanoarchaeia archaeon]|nr:TIM barrel protein [Candidatus Nanoarchaeia archaeon]